MHADSFPDLFMLNCEIWEGAVQSMQKCNTFKSIVQKTYHILEHEKYLQYEPKSALIRYINIKSAIVISKTSLIPVFLLIPMLMFQSVTET